MLGILNTKSSHIIQVASSKFFKFQNNKPANCT